MHYFGYTVVTIPQAAPSRPDFFVRKVSNFGLSAGDGSVGLGYNQAKLVTLPPEGAIYLEVATDAQFENAKRLIEKYEDLCIAQKNNLKTK